MSSSGEPFDRTPLTSLIEEVVAPHRDFGVAIGVSVPDDRAAEPVGARNPAILYGLGNLLENAVDFAHERVDVVARWDDETIEVAISDDGPGFAPDILDRIGEPYVTSRRRKAGSRLFHRQNPARAIRRDLELRQPRAAIPRRYRHIALEPQRIRAVAELRADVIGRALLPFVYTIFTRYNRV